MPFYLVLVDTNKEYSSVKDVVKCNASIVKIWNNQLKSSVDAANVNNIKLIAQTAKL
jgi:hypothetical protein